MTAPAPQSQPNTVELLARENDAEMARLTGLIFDEVNKNATLTARVEELETALRFIADGYDNHDVNHLDYRVKVYQVALDVLQPKGAAV